ncbi:Rieske 2Fe-2S domain-containing protein [Phaeovulum sp. W22_SRMD_FR3]|uniref:Rieske 2Fe-2S domain-containing protein n=1 Tax=Phaeovulum sp. W22_SRMD_FR3 TaxID=3240274 RepID=UPI003F9CD29D
MSWTDYAAAPPAGTFVCFSQEVTGVVTRTVETAAGRFPLVLLRSGAGLRAYVNACPHQYLPLDYRSGQLLSADGAKLMCSAHGAQFDAATGAAIAGADCGLDAVPLIEDGDRILIGP